MKKLSILTVALLAATAFSAVAADKQVVAKAPTLMTDAQMKKVVGAGSPGFGLCTATGFARGGLGAPGAIKKWTIDPMTTHQVGKVNGNGFQPGFGQYTAKGTPVDCGTFPE